MKQVRRSRNEKPHWHSEESQKREEELWTHAEELRTQGSTDDRNKKVRVDGHRRLKKIRDEEEEHERIAEELLEKKRIQEDELRSEFEDYLLSCEPTKKKG